MTLTVEIAVGGDMAGKQPLFRGRGFHIAMVIGGALVGAAIVIGVAGPDGANPLVITIAVVVGLVLTAVALVVGLMLGRNLVKDRIEVAYRHGDEKWRHGRLDVRPGALRLQPYAWQVQIPRGEPIDLDDVELGPDTDRRPPLKNAWSVNPTLRVLDVEASNGQWEFALMRHQIDDLRERLQGRAATPSS